MVLKAKKSLRLPLLAVLLLAGIFMFGAFAGAFIYATGSVIMETPVMHMVSHTEYRYGEAGQIVARLVDFQGNPVAVTNCSATILYPNKTFVVNSVLMTATGNIAGDHYYGFTTPSAGPEGVYEYQATCFYPPNKNASVTNSFHLSSAFNNVLSNLTQIDSTLNYVNSSISSVQGNLTAISSQVSAVNASLSSQITGLSNQLNTNISSVRSDISSLSTQVNANTSQVLSQVQSSTTEVLTAIQGNTTYLYDALTNVNSSVLAAIGGINVTVNLTPVLDAITALNGSTQQGFTDVQATLTSINSTLSSSIGALSSNMAANFSVVTNDLQSVNVTATNAYNAIVQVNTTANNIYTYVTTTLVGKVDQALFDLGVVNATVNRIETTTTSINSTVNSILQNQQDAVQMSVFSG